MNDPPVRDDTCNNRAMSDSEVIAKDWISTWDHSDGQPQLLPGRHLDSVVTTRLRDVLKQTALLWDEQNAWWLSIGLEVTYTPPPEPQGRHSYDVQYGEIAPVEAWAVRLGNIHAGLSAMRNNLFRDILTRSTGWSRAKSVRKLRNVNLDWPICTSAEDWKTFRETFSFIPEAILERIEVTQPFRDRMEDGIEPTPEWMRMNGVQSSRRFDSANKHYKPAEIGTNSVLGHAESRDPNVEISGVQQRFDTTDLTDPEPLLSFTTTSPILDPAEVQSISVVTMVRYALPDEPGMSPWGASRRDLWVQIIDHLFLAWTVQHGAESARSRTDRIALSRSWWANTPDARFHSGPGRKWQVGVAENIAQVALQELAELQP